MTKQEEIREGMIERFQNLWTVQTYEEKATLADYILVYLHSQGVVIKVEGELPQEPERDAYVTEIYHKAQQDMLKAGYVAVEPLIEDDK